MNYSKFEGKSGKKVGKSGKEVGKGGKETNTATGFGWAATLDSWSQSEGAMSARG